MTEALAMILAIEALLLAFCAWWWKQLYEAARANHEDYVQASRRAEKTWPDRRQP